MQQDYSQPLTEHVHIADPQPAGEKGQSAPIDAAVSGSHQRSDLYRFQLAEPPCRRVFALIDDTGVGV